jgi:hypothetical protein
MLGVTAGAGLLTATGDEHKQMRKVMNPAFSTPNLMAREFCPFFDNSHYSRTTQKPLCTGSRLTGTIGVSGICTIKLLRVF